MNQKFYPLLLTFFFFSFIFILFPKNIFAQQVCGGVIRCQEQGQECVCGGVLDAGNYCSLDSECRNADCNCTPIIVYDETRACELYLHGTRCGMSCYPGWTEIYDSCGFRDPVVPDPGECGAACSSSTDCATGLSCTDRTCDGTACNTGGTSCDKNCNGDSDCGSGWICAPSTNKCWNSSCGGSAYGCNYQTITDNSTGNIYQEDFSTCLPLSTSFTQTIKPNHSHYVDKTHFEMEGVWAVNFRDPVEFKFTTDYKSYISLGDTKKMRARVKNDGANATDNCNSIFLTNSCPNRDSQCVDYNFPTEIEAGSTENVSVTFKNTGIETWTPTWTTDPNYANIPGRMRMGSQDPMDNQRWEVGRVHMTAGSNIPISSLYTFDFDITAPSAVGRYSSKWQMLKEGVQWFGELCGSNSITVTPACPSNVSITRTGTDTATVNWTSAPAGVSNYILRIDHDWQNNECLGGDGVTPVPWFCGAQGDQWREEPDANISSGTEANSRNISGLDGSVEYVISVQSEAPSSTGGADIAGCRVTEVLPACTISCTEDCGTGVTLDETPGTISSQPTIVGLSSGKKYLTTNPQVIINWNKPTISSPATINGYDIWIFPQTDLPPANGATTCVGCQRISELNGVDDTSTTYTPQRTQTNEVSIYVRAKNTSCTTTRYGDWSPVTNVDYIARVSGTIYDSVVTQSGGLNNCSGDGGGTPENINTATGDPIISQNYGSGTTAPGVNNYGTGTTLPGYEYVLGDIPYNPDGTWYSNLEIQLDLTNYSDPENSYYCNCPHAGDQLVCNHTDTNAPATDENFFVTSVDLSNGPWWQTSQGNVYGTSGYTNLIPDNCDLAPACNANLITQNTDDDSKSAGVPMTGGVTLEANGYYTEFNEGGALPRIQPRAISTGHSNIVKENFDYFIREIDVSNTQSISGTQTSLPTNGTTYDDAVVFYADNTDVTFNLSTTQTVPAGTKLIYMVDGDIYFSSDSKPDTQIIDVEEGGYVAFIASGNIIFQNDVGNVLAFLVGGSTDTNIAGVFIADGIIEIADNGDDAVKDNMFVGEGTFVGWNGINLERTYDNTSYALDTAINNEYPTELFHFRPDFNKNTPEIMLKPNLVWQEVN